MRAISLFISLMLLVCYGPQQLSAASPDDPFQGLPLLLEISAARIASTDEVPAQASTNAMLLGQPARVLPAGDEARRMVYRIGPHAELKAGRSYLLEIDYPDDVPRAFFFANRGADFVRGLATGSAVGDPRRQYVETSSESLAYPQSGHWTTYRQFFVLQERFQGIIANRNADPGCRPFTPEDGFHLLIFQTTRSNDPRSQGAAIGRIRLYAVPNPESCYATLNLPPKELPRRRVFWREEMADQAISGKASADRAFDDPLKWFETKFTLSKVLGIDTFAKDLLEFGHNQGWDAGDPQWYNNAQPPLTDIWKRIVPAASKAGMTLLPYYEYKGGIGNKNPPSLGWQRRAEKLYHGIYKTADATRTDKYTSIYWVEDHNADLTAPDTLADAKRLLDRTVMQYKGQAEFAGAWFRTRDNHLPVSFSDAAVERFRADFKTDQQAQTANRKTLITSYESDQALYQRYIQWWLTRRAAFLSALQGHLAKTMGGEQQVIFTPWICEQVPALLNPGNKFQGIGLVTDDPAWWKAHAKTYTDSWYRWKWVPCKFDEVVSKNWWEQTLAHRQNINDSGNYGHTESWHSAPGADPQNYSAVPGVMMTYPIGRLFTVAGTNPISQYHTQAGLTVVHHYPLNENDMDYDKKDKNTQLSQPFHNVAGYVAADVDRAGACALLNEARAMAYGDPRNIGFLCAVNFSTGFPLEVRRFIQAFVALPALPSTVLPNGASDPDVVVREIKTPKHGTYYAVVNTSWNEKAGVQITLAGKGQPVDLRTRQTYPSTQFQVTLPPASLTALHVPKP